MKLTTVKYVDISEVELREIVKELDKYHDLKSPPSTAVISTTDEKTFFRVPLEFQKVDQETLFGDDKEGCKEIPLDEESMEKEEEAQDQELGEEYDEGESPEGEEELEETVDTETPPEDSEPEGEEVSEDAVETQNFSTSSAEGGAPPLTGESKTEISQLRPFTEDTSEGYDDTEQPVIPSEETQ